MREFGYGAVSHDPIKNVSSYTVGTFKHLVRRQVIDDILRCVEWRCSINGKGCACMQFDT